ncbi:MAG: hypothetical protein LBQ83_04980 [Candidatus Margulisbacteria bacterium]|jgi:hypothetical protein|nr:hypothetical protein [Candidatus Margulisiibacteriota bacterium]
MVDAKELQEKSKSQFGKFVPTPQKPFMVFLSRFFRKNTPGKSFLNGLISAGVLLYWWFERNNTVFAVVPLIVWVGFSVLMAVLGLIYWSAEKARLDLDIKRLEGEIQQIGSEISERKQYFERIRDEISKNSQN